MATKDWKKSGKLIWKNKNSVHRIILKKGLFDWFVYRKHSSTDIRKLKGDIKTKSKALAYAKAYMRKH